MRIGIDVASISRFDDLLKRQGKRFLSYYLSPAEIELCGSRTSSMAGFWAAKEALSKALGCGISEKCSFKDIVIKKTKRGAPKLKLSKSLRHAHKIRKAKLSITHDAGVAIAVVVIKKGKK